MTVSEPGYKAMLIESDAPLEVKKIVSEIHSRLLLHGLGDTVWLRNEIFHGETLLVETMNPSLLKYNQIYVTSPCDCDYNSPLKSEAFRRLDNDFTLRSGIFINNRTPQPSSDRKTILYQSVDRNFLAQWLALLIHSLAWSGQEVLQYQTCINCTLTQLADVLNPLPGTSQVERPLGPFSKERPISIIACGKP